MSNTNLEKYRFNDFTHEHYRKLLQIGKENYSYITFDAISGNKNFILWRHDVDFSIHEAEKLAIIENEEGVKATYFLLLHSEFYNLLEISITRKVQKIIQLGHNIALHFDPKYYEIFSEIELIKYLQLEKKIIEDLFNVKVNVFSFHNPDINTLKFDKFEYADMINTYSSYLKEKIYYCSDSNGYWKFDRLEDVLVERKHTCLQILTHPEWWTLQVMSPKQKVWYCIEGRAENNKKFYTDILKLNNKKNIDWE